MPPRRGPDTRPPAGPSTRINDAIRAESVRLIDADGEKQFLPDGKMKAGRLALGKAVNGEPIVLAEGFATAASISACAEGSLVVRVRL